MSWDAAGVMVTIVGGLASWVLRRHSKRNHIDFLVQNNVNLNAGLAVSGIGQYLQVSFGGKSFEALSIVDVVIHNTGNLPVSSSEYTKGITIQLEDCDVVANYIQASSAPDVTSDDDWTWDASNGRCVGAPALIKPKEWFVIRFLVNGELNDPTIDCRYAAQTRPPRDVEVLWRRDWMRETWGSTLAFVAAMFTLTYIYVRADGDTTVFDTWYLQVLRVVMMLAFGSFLASPFVAFMHYRRKNHRYQWLTADQSRRVSI